MEPRTQWQPNSGIFPIFCIVKPVGKIRAESVEGNTLMQHFSNIVSSLPWSIVSNAFLFWRKMQQPSLFTANPFFLNYVN